MTGEKRKSVTGYDVTSLTVEVSSNKQAKKMYNLTEVDKFACETVPHLRFNHSKRRICTYEFDMENLEEFKQGLQERYNIMDLQLAKLI